MKAYIKKTINIQFELNSSEAIMLVKGGRIDLELGSDIIKLLHDEDEYEDIDSTEYKMSINITDKNQFDWIISEALKHKQRVNDESKNT